MAATAEWLGTSVEALAKMGHVQQMDYVELYFKKISDMVGVPTEKWSLGDVYFAIFTPSIIKMKDDDSVYSKGKEQYERNKFHDRDKDGKITKIEISQNIQAFYEAGKKHKW